MLSICIPIYNLDVSTLVNALERQMADLEVDAELVLIDDASDLQFKIANEKCCEKHTYLQLKYNIGRTKIRNLFPKHAHYDYLLFLDCDATVISNCFLQKYIDLILAEKYQVICGGSIYAAQKPPYNYRLRWKNGRKREMISEKRRNDAPYASFMTSNVLIRKSVFQEVIFDEEIVNYGHEDTLFGFELRQKNIHIFHCDNAILNEHIDSNAAFLEKTEEAIANLSFILTHVEDAPAFVDEVKLLRTFFCLKRKKAIPLLNLCFKLSKKPIKFFLEKGFVNLYLFDFYRLGLLSRILA